REAAAAMTGALDSLRDDHDQLQRELESARNELAVLAATRLQYEQERQLIQSDRDGLRRLAEELRGERDRQCDALQQHIASLVQERDLARSERDAATGQWTQDLTRAEQQQEAAKQHNGEMASRLEALHAELQAQRERVSELTRELEASRAEIATEQERAAAA